MVKHQELHLRFCTIFFSITTGPIELGASSFKTNYYSEDPVCLTTLQPSKKLKMKMKCMTVVYYMYDLESWYREKKSGQGRLSRSNYCLCWPWGLGLLISADPAILKGGFLIQDKGSGFFFRGGGLIICLNYIALIV